MGNDKLKCIYGPQTYEAFEIQITVPAAVAVSATSTLFAGSANSIFSRVTTTSNGGLLEDFNKCNVYIPIVYDLTIDPDTRNNYYSFFGNSTTPVGATATAASMLNVVSLTIETCKTGAQLVSYAMTAAGGSNAVTVSNWRSYGFLIPSIIGSFSKKLFPIS